jgi:hypothetical protein
MMRGCTPGCAVVVDGFGRCGFRTPHDCPRPYNASEVLQSAALWNPSNTSHALALEEAHRHAENACAARPRKRAPGQLAQTGGWCLRPSHNDFLTVNISYGRASNTFRVPQTIEHGMPNLGVVRILHNLLHPHGKRSKLSKPHRSILDLGAGVGQYGLALRAIDSQHLYRGFDGERNP